MTLARSSLHRSATRARTSQGLEDRGQCGHAVGASDSGLPGWASIFGQRFPRGPRPFALLARSDPYVSRTMICPRR